MSIYCCKFTGLLISAQYQPSGVYKTKTLKIINKQSINPQTHLAAVSRPGSPTYLTKTCCLTSKATPSFVPGITIRCDSGKTSLTSLYGVQPQGVACHTKTTSLALRNSQNPCLCSTYTIRSAASYLSLKHHCRRHNRRTHLTTHSTQNPINKSAQNST